MTTIIIAIAVTLAALVAYCCLRAGQRADARAAQYEARREWQERDAAAIRRRSA